MSGFDTIPLEDHQHVLKHVMRHAAIPALEAEIQHCRDELALANAEHLAWLLDGTVIPEPQFYRSYVAPSSAAAAGASSSGGHAPRKALSVKRQKK